MSTSKKDEKSKATESPPKPTTDLEKKRSSKALTLAQKGKNIADFINSDESLAKIKDGAPKYLTPDSVTRVALTAMGKNQKLLACTQGSILQALIDCAAYGLVPNSTTNEAHLVPYADTCVLIVGFKGLIKMATNTGLVSHVEVSNVFENDKFKVIKGLNKNLIHEPSEANPGKYIGSYAVVIFVNGLKDFEYISREEGLEHGKKYSKNFPRGDSPWKRDEQSMITKTAVRKVLKYVPMSPASEKLLEAISRDEIIETTGEYVEDREPRKEIKDPQPLKKEPDLFPERDSLKKTPDQTATNTPGLSDKDVENKRQKQPDQKRTDNIDPDTGEIVPDWVLDGLSEPPKGQGELALDETKEAPKS